MKKKIKLVHIISILQHGGAESVLISLLDQLGSDAYEHAVIYFHGGPSVARLEERGIPVYQVTGALLLGDPLFWVRLFRLVRHLQPDLIHAHLWAANVAARCIGKILGIPVINTLHNKLAFQGAVRNTIDFISLPLASAVVGIGQVIVSSGKRWPYNERKIECIANGIDVHAVQQRAAREAQFREQFGWDATHIVFGSVGRFEHQKNYHTLLEAFALLHAQQSHTRLLLVGGGSLEQSLRARAQELAIAHVVQFVVGKTAYGYYPMMDAFILSSYYEGLSIALLEALSCGIPAMSTGMHGSHELLQPYKTGIYIEAPTVQAVYHAMNTFTELPDRGKQLAASAKTLVEDQYSLAAMGASYAKLYQRLIEHKKIK